jgi:uncharacterized protein YndB with AHSA1/START domain
MTPATSDRPRHATEFTTPNDVEVVATRVFDAPRQVVWDVFTRAEHLPHWMTGPDGWTMPVCEVDFRVGGKWHFVWRRDDERESEFGMTGEYLEIVPIERYANTENWGGDWPEATSTYVFSDTPDGGTLTVCTARFASKEVRDRAIGTGMNDGWGTSYARLDAYLSGLGG